MTEKDLLHKRERKRARRRQRKKELAKDPLRQMVKELKHLEVIVEGKAKLDELYAPLLQEEEERHAKEEELRGE